MKTILILATLALLVSPIAAAGPGASADTLAGESRCDSWSSWDSGEWSSNDSTRRWWSSAEGEKCSDEFDYAAAEAHDDDGEIASASASADQANWSTWSYYDEDAWSSSSSWRSWSSWSSYQEAWSRSANASTRWGDAGGAYSCGSAGGFGSFGSSSSQNDSAYSSYGGGGWADESRCGATAAALGGDAFVGNRCSSRGSWNEYDRYEGTYSWGSSNDQDTSGCFWGAESGDVSAGLANGCSRSSHDSYEAYWNGNETVRYGWGERESTCSTGLVATGPDGASLFAGQQNQQDEWCQDGNCTASNMNGAGLILEWDHNPLGPYPIGIWQTLP